MKWRIVETRVWEVEAKDHAEALKVFNESEPSPPSETKIFTEDWWTEARCDKLAEIIRDGLDNRIGVCNDTYDWGEFGPWLEKAQKVINESFNVNLMDRKLDDYDPTPAHGRRLGTKPIVDIWVLEGADKDDDSCEWSLNLPEDIALKVLFLGGF